MKRFSESRMREIRTSGSMRGERTAPFVSSALLLYRELFALLADDDERIKIIFPVKSMY
jgi:hypothetical protein